MAVLRNAMFMIFNSLGMHPCSWRGYRHLAENVIVLVSTWPSCTFNFIGGRRFPKWGLKTRGKRPNGIVVLNTVCQKTSN